ncbi:MAG: intradiol ring-cleavage dioxygenase [Alphaproteobacteria bacterium]|nr:intradiol ring-cleavage dioxygenase [Alphaproteobacteria bacterium]
MTRYFSEDTSEQAVIARLENCDDPRFRTVMEGAIKHLHAFVKEVEPTLDEWMAAIEFLTKTGQICDDKRQEWILASDTLGVSMLVDAINHRKPHGATENTVLGPFHVAGAPELQMGDDICRDGIGEPCVVRGVVADEDGNPISGAELDVWQTNGEGFYDVQQPTEQPQMNLRGKFRTGSDGAFWFKTVKPVPYPVPTDGPVGQLLEAMGRHPYRPAHIHFIVSATGFEQVTTHVFVDGDPYLESDAVFGVKDSLVLPFEQDGDAWSVTFNIGLAKAA